MKRALLAGILVGAVTLSGCDGSLGSIYTNFREIEQLQLVQTMGFDGGTAGVTLSVSAGQGESGNVVVLTAAGASVGSACEHLQDYAARTELYFAHTRYVLVGEDAARQGVYGLLDWFERGTQTRIDLPLFIVEDGSAQALILGSGEEKFEVSEVLASLQQDVERHGDARCFSLCDVARSLARSGAALCCSIRAVPAGPHAPAGEGEDTALHAGYAVLADGRLASFADRETARGISLLLDQAGTGSVVLSDGAGGRVTVEFDGGKTTVDAEQDENGGLLVRATLRYKAGIVEMDTTRALDEALLAELDDALNAWLRDRVERALTLSRTLEADFMELSLPLRLTPEERTAALRGLRWELDCRGEMERSYDLAGAMGTEDHHERQS